MITDEQLKTIARLKDDTGHILLCDHLQAVVDDMADEMAEDDLTSDARLQKVHMWRAARKILAILKFYPEELSRAFKAEDKSTDPDELKIDEKAMRQYLATLK